MKSKLLIVLFFSLFLLVPAHAEDIAINFQPVPNQPYFESQEVMIDAEEYGTLVLRINSKQSGTARLYWAISYDPQFNPPKSLWFSIRSGEHNYYFNLPSQNPNWVGWVKKLLILPEFDPNNLEIKTAQAVHSDLFTNIASGWQEFWGPKGRLIIGSSINTMQSPVLFDKPIFFYFYWLFALALLGTAIWIIYKRFNNKQKIDLNELFKEIGKYAIILVIIFWLLLEFSSMISYMGWVKSDWKYVGKNLEQKLTLANTGDFYPFIQFCEKNIPLNAKFDILVPPVYNDIKAKYYLFPRQAESNSEYLIVYDMKTDDRIAKDYSLWQTFRKEAFIMKRKQAK